MVFGYLKRIFGLGGLGEKHTPVQTDKEIETEKKIKEIKEEQKKLKAIKKNNNRTYT